VFVRVPQIAIPVTVALTVRRVEDGIVGYAVAERVRTLTVGSVETIRTLEAEEQIPAIRALIATRLGARAGDGDIAVGAAPFQWAAEAGGQNDGRC